MKQERIENFSRKIEHNKKRNYRKIIEKNNG
jgi:hypothetical protein